MTAWLSEIVAQYSEVHSKRSRNIFLCLSPASVLNFWDFDTISHVSVFFVLFLGPFFILECNPESPSVRKGIQDYRNVCMHTMTSPIELLSEYISTG